MKVNELEDCNRPNKMLEFAKRHKMPIILSSIGAIILAGGIAILNRPCPYEGKLHQHYYKLQRYGCTFEKGSSLERIWGWEKEDKVTFNDVVYKYDKANNKNLFSIKDNIEKLQLIKLSNPPYLQYEYSYIHTSTYYTYIGKVPIPHTRKKEKTDWITNPTNEKLTGKVREVVVLFRGIKIGEDGEDVFSDWVEFIDQIDEYHPYMDYDSCVKVEYIMPRQSTIEKAHQK